MAFPSLESTFPHNDRHSFPQDVEGNNPVETSQMIRYLADGAER